MKKALNILLLSLFACSGILFSQDKKEQTKSKIKPALLVIDIQNAYLTYIPEREKEMGMYMIDELIKLFRAKGFPVIRIYNTNEQYGPKPGSFEFEFPTSVPVSKDDPQVIKTYGDAFNKTDLDKILKEKGSNTLFLCGLSAVGCVLATWVGSQNHDYKAFMVKEAIMSHDSDYTNNVETMFDAVGYDVVEFILDNTDKN